MTNLRSLSDLFKAAMNLAAACAFATAIATGASAQTNTFPENGNAGIGTTTPAYPLTVNQTGNGVNRLVSLANDSSGTSAQSAISFFEGAIEKFKFGMNGSGATGYVGGANAFQLWHFQNAPIVFGTNSIERMRINGVGNIGIGTTTPGAKLEIFGTYDNDPGGNHLLRLGGIFGFRQDDGTYKNLHLDRYNSGWSTPMMSFDRTTGNVGIGRTAPASKLEVAGTIHSTTGGIKFPDGSVQTTAASGSGSVSSVFGRSGAVVAATNDYTWAQINKTASSLADITTRSASDLSTGTLPDARFPATLPAISGANLTSLNASNLASGTAAPARLGSGTANNTTFLRGDSTWAAITSSQWANGSGNINYTAGNVGIGTTAPDYTLELSGATAPKFAVSDTGVAHGVTTFAQTDSYFMVDQATAGGARVWGFSDTVGDPPLHLLGVFGSTDPTDTAAAIQLRGAKRSGTSITTLGNTETVLKVMNQSTDLVTVLGAGNVGIGTTPGALYKLDVQGKINSSELCIATDCKSSWSQVGGGGSTSFSSVTAGTNTVALVVGSGGSLGASGSGTINATTLGGATFAAPGAIGGTTPGTGAFSAVGINAAPSSYKLDVNGNTNVTGNITVAGTGNVTATGTIEAGNIKAKYQDLAEWVPSSEQLVAGTVVVLDTTKSNQVISSGTAYDTRVAGVISAQPGITLGEGGAGKVLVATTGRVRVKVDASRGAIQIGDLLVTSDVLGVAMKSEAVNLGGVQIHRPGTIIGKALEPLAKGSGEILVLLSLQ